MHFGALHRPSGLHSRNGMEYRTLGRTGIKVSAIGMGTMTFGEQNSEADGHAQLDLAFEHGVNFIDTAEVYAVPPRAETKIPTTC
jgi:aryl-alcohol dehydrogenase-like predicted oxidoreductase